MLLCFDRWTCMQDGYPIYDAKYCHVLLSYVQMSAISGSSCDADHFLAFAMNETEQQNLLKFIYDRKSSQKYFCNSLCQETFSRIILMNF